MFIGLALFVSASISIWLTRMPGEIALFWPGSAVAACLLLRLPRIRWLSAVLVVVVALLLTNLAVGHRPWFLATIFASLNAIEIFLMVTVFRFVWRFPYPNITMDQASIMVAVLGLAIPGLCAIAGGLLLHTTIAAPFGAASLQWWSSHAIGTCILGPLLILFSVGKLKRLLDRKYRAENALTLIACLAGCYFAIRYIRFPFVSIGLILLMAAFRVGGFGASIISCSVGLLITNLWMLGVRPSGIDPAGPDIGTLVGLPVIALLATIMPPIAVGLGSDARRATARALRVSERRFRESMEHSPIGMLIANLDGIWSYSNLALQQMLGYTAEELRAMPPGGPADADDWEENAARWRPLVAGKADFYDTVRRFRHKDGHWIWMHVAVSILRDEDRSPIHLIAQMESLEARRHAEQKLAEERERLRITLQAIDDAVITTDADTRITYVNAAAESLLGLDLTALQSRLIDEVIHLMDPLTSKTAVNLIGDSILQRKVLRREQPCLLHRPDGTVCHVTDVVSPVLDGAGLVTGLVIVLHDATRDVHRTRDMQHRALHDPLTGLSNRADFEQHLRLVFKKSQELRRPAAVIAIDLDRFKAVNDAAGHAAGDAMLRKVAEACRLTVRSSDMVARLGGDEFAIVLDNCAAERADLIGQQILRALNPLEVEWGGSRYSINASIGLAMNSMRFASEQAWLEAADKACFVAKRAGRGQLRTAGQGGDPSEQDMNRIVSAAGQV